MGCSRAYRTQSPLAKNMAHRERRPADPAHWLHRYVSGGWYDKKVRDQSAENDPEHKTRHRAITIARV